jgi:hypothetical protein
VRSGRDDACERLVRDAAQVAHGEPVLRQGSVEVRERDARLGYDVALVDIHLEHAVEGGDIEHIVSGARDV